MIWESLSKQDATAFLQTVDNGLEPVFFDPDLCEVYRKNLPFYDGFALMRIVNKQWIPAFVLDYFSNGEQHYYLDGSERAFHNVNIQGAVKIQDDSVLDYIRMFISYVYERGNSLIFINNPNAKAAIPQPVFNSETESYELSLPLIYQSKEVPSQIEVTRDGKIFVKEPLEVSFLTELQPDTGNPLLHPYAEQVLEQIKSLLSVSNTAQAMLNENPEANIQILGTPNYQSFVTNGSAGYITMPAAEQNGKYMQALCYAAALRGIKQLKDGHFSAHPEHDKEIYTTINYGKNLDIFIEICKIVEEFEVKDITEPLGALAHIGLLSAYKSYKSGIRDYDLMAPYIQSLTEAGFMGKEEV